MFNGNIKSPVLVTHKNLLSLYLAAIITACNYSLRGNIWKCKKKLINKKGGFIKWTELFVLFLGLLQELDGINFIFCILLTGLQILPVIIAVLQLKGEK